jgi:D-serine deaminase-like pyridoxal phosphate-dependent protein
VSDRVETPCLRLDLDRLEVNLDEMAERSRAAGVALRPHVKTHKMAALGQWQMERGAVGLTTAKLSEAEALARHGLNEMFVCYPLVGDARLHRLRRLARAIHVMTIVDSEVVAAGLARAVRAEARPLDVLIKLDAGSHRVGVDPERARELAELVARMPELRLRGVCIHEGSTYGEPEPELRRAIARKEAERLVATARGLRSDGHEIEIVSAGSTPGVEGVLPVDGVTEIRPGNYVFNDLNQVALGVVGLERCALSVFTTVVSRPASGRAIVDAGAKALTLDRGAHGTRLLSGFGAVVGRPDVTVARLSEEHGWLELGSAGNLAVGEMLEIVPNHACAVVNNFDRALLTRDGSVVDVWPVDARGCMT